MLYFSLYLIIFSCLDYNNLTCQDKILRDLMKKRIAKKQIIGIDCPKINKQKL